MPRPTRRLAALVGGSALLFLIGTNVQSGWLFVLSALLLGAAVGGMALPTLMLRGVEVTRSAPLEATQGSAARVRLEVTNASRGMRWMLLLEDEHLSPARMFVASLAPGERIALEGERIAGRRGVCGPSRVIVSSMAPFGVGRARIALEPEGTTTVLPAWTRLDDPGARSSAPASGPAARPRIRRGAGPEYLGIREYRWGDSMRHVHWPSTARTGAVMVREFEEELRASLAIVVDTFADVAADIGADVSADDGADRAPEPTPMDRACSVAASIALTSIEEGLAVRLAAAVEGAVDILDDADPHRVLRWLAELSSAGGIPLDVALGELASRPGRVDGLVVVAPTWRANTAHRLTAGLGSAGSASLVLIDAHAFGGTPSAPIMTPEESERTATLITARGVEVTRVRREGDLAALLGRSTPWLQEAAR